MSSLDRDKIHHKMVIDDYKRNLDFHTRQYKERLKMEEDQARMQKENDL